MTTVSQEVDKILNPGINAIDESARPDIGDAMNLLGRVVAAVEHLAKEVDELRAAQGV